MQILFLLYNWKPHVISNPPAQTDWQTTSLRKCLICHQVSTLFSFPLWSKLIILHLCKYICVAYLFTCCWVEQTSLHSFLVMHSWSDCIFPVLCYCPQWGIHRCSQNIKQPKARAYLARVMNISWPPIPTPKESWDRCFFLHAPSSVFPWFWIHSFCHSLYCKCCLHLFSSLWATHPF